MSYTPTNYVNGSAPAINATNLNKSEQRLAKAVAIGESTNIGEGTISFDEVVDSSSGGTATIDFSSGQKHVITLTENTTLSFIAPSSVCHVQLRVLQDATGGWTLTLPSGYKAPSRLAYEVSLAGNAEDILSIYYDGSAYTVSALKDVGVVV